MRATSLLPATLRPARIHFALIFLIYLIDQINRPPLTLTKRNTFTVIRAANGYTLPFNGSRNRKRCPSEEIEPRRTKSGSYYVFATERAAQMFSCF